MYTSTLSLTSALDRLGGQRHAPAALPIVMGAGWAAGCVWTGAENLAPPSSGFDARTVQPTASR
jgi:hypothetical protein